jgi:hypothetical protein
MATGSMNPSIEPRGVSMEPQEHDHRPSTAMDVDTRAAGFLMLVATVASIVFVALDPVVSADGSRAILQAIVANGPAHRVVHAAELACVLCLAFGFTSLAARIGPRRPAVLGACVAYVAGCLAMVGAAVTDGFVTGDVARYFLQAGHSADTGREMIHLCYVVVQDLAAASWFFQSAGVLAMAAALLREAGMRRIVGLVGLATGAVPPIAIVATWPTMDTGVIVGVLFAQAAWNAAAASLLLRRAPSHASAMPVSAGALAA